ncbi:amidohydrolase family protein, partial [uncultured Mitsuokella sp.]|uniref:amidohydrolase family protein n=1 Tax=uncultured Mitsuokella sp. TaxID=453120 RepID=UPI0026125CDF
FAWVEETGLFDGGKTLAAHCVHLDESDISIIKRHDIRVAHNPGSNMKLASGIAPVPKLLAENVCVALGTDGTSSNNNLDMLEEVNLAAMLHKVGTLDPLAVPAEEALRMGTEYGATALGLAGVGKLQVGYKADITLFSMDTAAWYPRHNLVSLLVYSAHSSSVDTVLVNGKILMEKRELKMIDEEEVLYSANRCAAALTR